MVNAMHTLVKRIKDDNPLILNVTNYVSMNFVANGLLSIGASPVMSHAEEELDELIALSKAVVINPGTLNPLFVARCERACRAANQRGVPVILDPVGAGATRYRTDTCLRLMTDYQIAIIRGNASEILALSGQTGGTKGVDSVAGSEEAVLGATALSRQYLATVVVSGKKDLVTDGDALFFSERGSALMPMITGTGCLLTAVIGAFHTVEKNRAAAAHAAVEFYGMCGEKAEKQSAGPGTFRAHFLDALHAMPEEAAI